ncbi:MAG TPA: DUF4382 domain-containing protein [Gemmatimonadaceae bacterium]|nr:DUF4382 domain-containing protein [Gemmatimonadaceae bacterium]
MQLRRIVAWTSAAAALSVLALACSSDSTLPSLTSGGTLIVKLSDAPFLSDSVKSVDVFVVEIDGRGTATDDNDANTNLDNSSVGGWTVLGTPNQSFNLLALQNGASAQIGSGGLAAGTYSGFRLIIDQSKSSVTLKNGTVLTGTSNPGIKFPSASKSGLKINLSKPVTIVGGSTTTLLVDFDVNDSFVLRGNTISQNGLLFKPVINGTIIDAATVNANVRLANAMDVALDLRQGTSVVSGGSNLAFAGVSSCTSVNATTPGLGIALTGTTTNLSGFTPTLVAGNSYTFVAFGTSASPTFITLVNTFTPASGQAGFRVFNATGGATAIDAFVTTPAAVLAAPATVSGAVTGTATAFVSVPAGSQQIRLTSTGLLTPLLLDVGSQTLAAGTNYTLVIAPPASGSTTLRAFLVPGC